MKWIWFLQKITDKVKQLYSADIHYINGADTLPAPLPLEEEQRLLKDYDGTQLETRQILIEHNLRLWFISHESSIIPVSVWKI